MKQILAVIGILATTYPAQAQNVLPPLEFDHPYEGATKVWRSASQDEIKAKCPPSVFPYHLGCGGKSASGACHILMADDETIRKYGWTPEIVLRHEIGHCNGWPVHHPGARSATSAPKSPAPSPEPLLPGLASGSWRDLP
jgi:hypothetical protein